MWELIKSWALGLVAATVLSIGFVWRTQKDQIRHNRDKKMACGVKFSNLALLGCEKVGVMWGEFGIAASRNSSLFSGSVWMCSTLLFVNSWWDGSQSWTVSLTLICLDFYLIFLMVRSCCLNPKLLFAVQFDCRHKCSSCVIYDSGALRVRFRDLWVFKNKRSRSGLLLGGCLMVCHLAGLFNMLSDNSHETRKQADAALSEFLQEIKNAPVLNCSLQEFSLQICKGFRGVIL